MGAFSSKITKARTKHFDKDAWTGPWRFAENWSDLLDANRAFLRGETNRSPYYRSNISPETQSLVPGLLELHEFGFLTYSSQPFRDDEDVKFSRCECGQRAAYEQIKQRAFLSFLVPASALGGHAQRFRAELESEHEIHVATLEYAGSCKEGCCRIASKLRHNFPDGWATHMIRSAETYREAIELDLRSTQFIDMRCSKIISQLMEINNVVMGEAKPVIFHVLAKDWSESDLAKRIAAAAKRCGLERVFVENDEESESEDDHDGGN